MSRAGREYIRYVHPRQRTPSHRIKRDVYIQHRRHRLARGGRRGACRRRRVGLQNRADDEEQDAHARRGDHERVPPPEGVDEEEHEERGRDHLHDSVDPRREQRVRGSRITNLPVPHAARTKV